MATGRIPTPETVIGAANNVFELLLLQPTQTTDGGRFSFGERLGHEEEGVLTMVDLRGAAADAYSQLQSLLWAACHWGRAGSSDALSKLVRHFILEMAVDPGPGRRDIKGRFAKAIKARIGGTLSRWRVIAHVPARAATIDVFNLGGMRFRGMVPEQRSTMKAQVLRNVGARLRVDAERLCDGFEELHGRDLACEVEVEAPDAARAFVVAQEMIFDRLDSLAGIGALCRRGSEGHTDPRRWAGPRIAFQVGGDGSGRALFPPDAGEVDLTEVIRNRKHRFVKLLLRLLDKKEQLEGERRLLRAVRWLGRSHRAGSEEVAYLHAVIAFEIILGGMLQGSIGYTLSLRYAQLRSKGRGARRRLRAAVGPLYNKRSAIAHAGSGGVDFADLTELWTVVNQTLLAFMERGFHRKTDSQIADWFEAQS